MPPFAMNSATAENVGTLEGRGGRCIASFGDMQLGCDDDAPGAWAWAERSARLAADDGSRIGDAGNNGGRMAEWLQLD